MRKTILSLASICILIAGCSKKEVSVPVENDDQLQEPAKRETVVNTPSIPSGTFNITSYGGSTGSADNAPAILQAINAASAAGGGTVVIPSGTFLSGPLKLKNNVGLLLSSGTVLKPLAYGTYPGSGGTADLPTFIDVGGLTNVKISGAGTIDGQGAAWWSAYSASKASGAAIARPGMIGSNGGASTVEISGIKIQNAPNNHIGIGKNNNSFTISGITISSPSNSPNTDGIGVWSPNVNIINCNISCGDDNIAMNSASEYVTISGCTFGSGHGVAIGSYAANIDHITVNDCTFNGTDNGVRIKSNRTRSGTVQYLTYSNLTMNNVSNPFFISQYYPDNTTPSTPNGDSAKPITSTTPVWKHFTFKNITVNGAAKAGIIWAVPEKPMVNLIFDNVKINSTVGMVANYVSSASFINGSRITATNGNAFISTYSSNITGINLTTGAAQ